jgi:hypothetical protein
VQIDAGDLYNLLSGSDSTYDTNPFRASEDVDISTLDEDIIQVASESFESEALEAAKNLLQKNYGKPLISADYTEYDQDVIQQAAEEMGVTVNWATPEQEQIIISDRNAKAEAEIAARCKQYQEAQAHAAVIRNKWVDRAKFMLAQGMSAESVRQAVIASGEDVGSPHPQIIYTLRQLGLLPRRAR